MRGWRDPNSPPGSTARAASPGRRPRSAFDPEGVSIQRLNIEDGRAILGDAASGTRLTLDKIEFKGEVRSLAGPVKGEGSFVVGGHHYPYRVALGRVADDGGIKLRLTVDPIDRPLTADADLSIWVDRGAPRYEGSLTLARAVGRALRRRPHRIVARHQPGQRRRRRRRARADRVPVRARRAGDQAARRRQADVRQPAAGQRRAVLAAARSRPHAGAAGGRPGAGRWSPSRRWRSLSPARKSCRSR